MPSTKQQGSTHLFEMRRQNLYTLATFTAWKVSKYGVISCPYFPVFGLNTERYGRSLRIQSEYRKIRIRNNSVFGHFSRNLMLDK